MRPPRRAAVVLVVLALLAAPGAAFAQGAGDDQYQDPFAGEQDGGAAEPGPGPEPAVEAPSSGADAPVSSAPDDGAPAAAAADAPVAGAEAGSTASPATLPYTGADPLALVVAGGILLLVGTGLRLRTADERRA